uniref:HAUS augmin-like complex subunit 3 N-terminal domain-containing protein n=1 Tax=Leersia perrieri TaxID=77586 RepID=A0A0D9WWA9_9ORYZ
MSAAAQLCDALAAAGFDGGDGALDADSLEWPFLQGDDTRRLLAWLSSRLRPANVLSATDLALYEELELEGKLLEMNSVLGKLSATTQELSYYHSEADIGIYLSYSDFQSYIIHNLACTKELDRWFSKKFKKGPLQFVAKEDISRGDYEKFARSNRQYIDAQAEYAKEQAILSTLRTQLASQQSHVHQDVHSLKRRSSELAEELRDLSLQVKKFLSEVITSLCADLAQLEGANILQGDHNLKVLRQECYISQQKRFINYLVNQLAANQFLKIACQIERQAKLSSAYSLLKAIAMELQGYLSVVDGRLDRYHLVDQAASEMLEEGPVDDRDTFLHAVRDILSSHSGAQAMTSLYVSAYGLVEQISDLQTELDYLHHELENVLPRERKRCIDELCRMIQTLEQILSVPFTNVQPTLTPWPLAQALEELEIINQQVSTCVNEVTMARDKKSEMLQQPSRNVQQERRVFVDFFCHPGRLENQVREMSSHVRALPD